MSRTWRTCSRSSRDWHRGHSSFLRMVARVQPSTTAASEAPRPRQRTRSQRKRAHRLAKRNAKRAQAAALAGAHVAHGPFSKRALKRFMRRVRRASARSIAYLLINAGLRIHYNPETWVTLRHMIVNKLKTVDARRFAEVTRVSQFLAMLAGSPVRQSGFERAIWEQDRRTAAALVRDALEAHGGTLALQPFDVLLLYTVTPNDPASKGRNEVIGRFRVTSVSLLEAAEVRVCCSVLCMSLPCTVAGRRS